MQFDPNTLLKKALALYQAGNFTQARALYQQLLQLFPRHPELLRLLGATELRLGRLDEALRQFDAAIAAAPKHADAWSGRGSTLLALGRLDSALESFDKALALRPNDATTLHNRGLVLQRLGRVGAALETFDRALAMQPDAAVIHNSRGNAALALSRPSEAIASYDRAIALQPDYAEPYNNRGNALRERGQLDLALASYDRALALKADDAEAHNNRGLLLLRLQRFDEALASFDRALALRDNHAEALRNRGNVLQQLGRIEDAVASYDRAIALRPDFADAFNNRANALLDLDRTNEALADYERALALQPDNAGAGFNLSLIKLLRGEYDEGWALYERRWQSSLQAAARKFAQPLWLGQTPVAGRTLLLHAEQGLGDTLQFCRYVPLVAALGARVILEVPAPLAQLLAGLDGCDQIVVRGDELPAFDAHCPLMSLPHAFRTTVATIPAPVPYLRCDPAKSARWRERLGNGSRKRVGLVWSGGHRADQPELWAVNDRRNIALRLLEPLNVGNIDFVSLQKGEEAEAQLRELVAARWNGPALIDFTAELQDFADTAALIDNLDLVIAVDTSTAHLAGALGKPLWLLNRYDTCWRWLLDRADSPWYPTATLFRQTARGDWSAVVAAVRQRLIEWSVAA
jgi:tetratricopeptide (TPR) repeat protein